MGVELKNTTKNSGGPSKWRLPAELQLLPSRYMDGLPLFLVVFLSSAPIKTYPWTRPKPYVLILVLLILLLAAPS